MLSLQTKNTHIQIEILRQKEKKSKNEKFRFEFDLKAIFADSTTSPPIFHSAKV